MYRYSCTNNIISKTPRGLYNKHTHAAGTYWQGTDARTYVLRTHVPDTGIGRVCIRVRAVAMAIVRTMVPTGTMVHVYVLAYLWYYHRPPTKATFMYLECEPYFFRLRRALRQPRVARLIGK